MEKITVNVEIKNQYTDFESFMTNEKDFIYEKIINTYNQLASEKKNIDLNFTSMVDNITFKTNFDIDKKNKWILTETIMPYFEKVEKYEICHTITKIDKLIH